MNTNIRNILIAVVAVVVVGIGARYLVARFAAPAFCFDFVHDMQFGDRKVAHPFNQPFGGPGGIMYYIPEVPALQTALAREGFYIDPYESTGGKVYSAAFFGPSTRAAVMSFQKKYGLSQTGEVNNDTLDKLAALYACPKAALTASSTPVLSTTTPAK